MMVSRFPIGTITQEEIKPKAPSLQEPVEDRESAGLDNKAWLVPGHFP